MDLDKMEIQLRLYSHMRYGGKGVYMEIRCAHIIKSRKKNFCQCLHDIKVRQGYSSNMANLVSMKDFKISGMKSHDYHVLMQQLFPIDIRGITKDDVRSTITRLSIFFNSICSKVIDV